MQNCMSHLGGTFQNRMPHNKFRTCKNRDSTSSPDSEQDYCSRRAKTDKRVSGEGFMSLSSYILLHALSSHIFLHVLPSPPSQPLQPPSRHLLLHILPHFISFFMSSIFPSPLSCSSSISFFPSPITNFLSSLLPFTSPSSHLLLPFLHPPNSSAMSSLLSSPPSCPCT